MPLLTEMCADLAQRLNGFPDPIRPADLATLTDLGQFAYTQYQHFSQFHSGNPDDEVSLRKLTVVGSTLANLCTLTIQRAMEEFVKGAVEMPLDAATLRLLTSMRETVSVFQSPLDGLFFERRYARQPKSEQSDGEDRQTPH